MDIVFRIAVCDDDAFFADKIYETVSDMAIQNNCKAEITKLYSGAELTEYCTQNPVDIIITDIDMPDFNMPQKPQMPNMEGFKAAKELQEKYPEMEILFVSAHEELAYQSFRYRPFSFISKKDLSLLSDDLTELLTKLKKRKTNNSLCSLTIDKKVYNINTDEIMYFKTNKHYLQAVTSEGNGKLYRISINEAYNRLKYADFIFVHRSYLINCKFIKYLDAQTVEITDGTKISVTRNIEKFEEAKRIFSKFKRSMR